MKYFKKIFKMAVMMGSVIVLSTLGIDAYDNRSDFSGSLLGSTIGIIPKEKSLCPQGMSYVQHPEKSFCIDTYTASTGRDCPYQEPKNQEETRINTLSSECEVVSEEGRVPWRYVSQTQAREVCRKNGKYLASAKEWYVAAQGTPFVVNLNNISDKECNVDSNWFGDNPGKTGSGERCVSGSGAYDMIGNVWEWIDGEVVDGKFEGVDLPLEGYIIAVNGFGIPIDSDIDQPDSNHGGDRIWVEKEGIFGVMKGGFYGSQGSAGIYAFHAKMKTSFAGRAVGFRCASEKLR